jgi:hypothetical protein
VVDADIEACFDCISPSALMQRVRVRVPDKRTIRLVKAYLRLRIMTELGEVVGGHNLRGWSAYFKHAVAKASSASWRTSSGTE